MQGFQPGEQRMIPLKSLVLWLSGWAIVLVGASLGLMILPDILAFTNSPPVLGVFLGILLALWVYLPVPPLLKAGVFNGWKGFLVLGGWCSCFLAGFAAWLLIHLPSGYLIPLAVLL